MFRCAHNLKGSSKSVGLTDIAEFIHKVEDYISLMRDGKLHFTSESSVLLLEVAQELRAWGEDLRVDPTDPKNQNRDSGDLLARIGRAGGLDDSASGGEKRQGSAQSNALDSDIIWTDSLDTKGANPEPQTSPQPNAPPKERPTVFVPVETVRVRRTSIDLALSQLAELSLEISRLRSTNLLGFNEAIELEKIVSSTHRTVFGTIQGTVDELFNFLQHTCTDVAKKTDKKIVVSVTGADTFLDKKILEQIKDPLMHVVRNAVDHGIELPQVRLESGKSEAGKIKLCAVKSPRGVWIEVHDDGRGLDARKLRAKAIEKKFIAADAVMTDKECFDLIFLAGFSTAGAVNQFSGRGVGMDVVKKAIQQVDGRIDIDSTIGRGSTFRLFIPAVSSLLDMFIVREGNSHFGITDNGVSEVLEFESASLGENPTTGLTYQYGDDQIPLLPLHAILGFQKPLKSRFVVVSKQREGCFGILIEDISGLRQQLVHQPEETFHSVDGLIGTTRLESGNATFVLDIDELLASRKPGKLNQLRPTEFSRRAG